MQEVQEAIEALSPEEQAKAYANGFAMVLHTLATAKKFVGVTHGESALSAVDTIGRSAVVNAYTQMERVVQNADNS